MDRNTRVFSLTLTLLLAAVLLAGCGSDSDPSIASGMLTPALEDDGFTLMADPAEVVIDTTTDPPEESGTTALTAVVLDPETDAPLEGVDVVFSTDGGTLASEGKAVTTDASGVATDTLTLTVDDPAKITVSAVESAFERKEDIDITKVVIFPNRPPVADAGEDQIVPCNAPGGAIVTLDGSGSSDPDSTPDTNDDIVSFEWYEDYGTPDESLLGEGETLDVALDIGDHAITLEVTDSEGETDTDETSVTVVDNQAPEVEVTLTPSMLWPPNHRMVDIFADVEVFDCSPYTVELVSVTSNEPANDIGDGNTEPDILGAEVGTEDYDFLVRAERSGGGSGRIYTVVYRVTDEAGFTTEASAYVMVPHDQGN